MLTCFAIASGFGLLGAASLSASLHLVNIAVALLGLAGLVGMVVFDLVLARTRLPTIARDLTQLVAFALLVILALRSGGLDPVHALAQSAVITAVLGLGAAVGDELTITARGGDAQAALDAVLSIVTLGSDG